jgi:hypothetical protein
LIDTNVWLGRWPFRRLPHDEPSALAAKLRRNGVTQAWAGSFEAVLGQETMANSKLAKACRRCGDGLFVPFGTVNVRAEGWREELKRCHEQYGMPGIRLLPNYHGYKLNEPELGEMLASAGERNLLTQVVLEIEDERVQHAPSRPPVDPSPLPGLLKQAKATRLMLLNWFRTVKPALLNELAEAGVLFDIAMVEGVGGVGGLFERIPASQIAFGSNAPFFYFEAALLKLLESGLKRDQFGHIPAYRHH